MVLCYHPSSHSDGLRDVPDFLSVTSCSQWQLARPSWRLPLGGARTVERQDELRGLWLGVRALDAEAAHGVGEGELPDRRARDHVVGAASCSEVSQVAVKCRATLLCATPLILCLADLSRTRRESFVACRCSRVAVYPIAWEKLRLMRLGCGDGSGCEACWCASCESSGG